MQDLPDNEDGSLPWIWQQTIERAAKLRGYPLARSEPPSMTRGYIKLGAVAERTAVLDVACTRCERRGRLSTARLVNRYGPEQSMGELRWLLAGDCPRLLSPAYGEQCDPYFPQLAALFAKKG